MERQEFKKIFWAEASKWGLILGGIMVALRLLAGVAGQHWLAMFILLAQVVAIFKVNMAVGRKMSALKSQDGYTFGNALSQILAVMMFAGIMVGAAEFVISRLSSGYFDAMFDNFEQFRGVFGDERIDAIKENRAELEQVMKNPFYIVVSKVIDMCLFGGMVGAFNAALLRRGPQPHIGNENEE